MTCKDYTVIFIFMNFYKKIFHLHSSMLKALANEKRLEIIHLLRDKEMTVGEIQSMLDLPQANLSQHLMVLREKDIVSTRKKGKEVFYKLNHQNFIKASDLIREVIIEKNKNSELADYFSIKMKDLLPLVHDPVCGMRISPKTASYAIKEGEKEYYFCASGCFEKFKNSPTKYR